MDRTFSIISLGCPKNTVDSEILRGELERAGWHFKKRLQGVECVIINTCGFIQPAKEESIETILQVLEWRRQGKIGKVIVWGCLTQRYFGEVRQELPEIDAIFGVDAQPQVLKYLTGRSDTCSDYTHSRRLLTPFYTAYLKIAEGCDNSCSFCAIPNIRGRQRSQTIDRLLAEAEYLHAQGVRELIIIAQDTTRYGTDLQPPRSLYDLLEALLSARLFPWVRLMYANPAFWQPRLDRLFTSYPELCPYLDIPIQHASDRLLRAMKRGITSKKMLQRLRRLQQERPDIALRTAVMVGYPGETEEDFNSLLAFLEEVRFARLGVFAYSQEEGTAAASLPDDIPAALKAERREIVERLQYDISHAFAANLIGRVLPVLIEKKQGVVYRGRSPFDAPEVDCNVLVASRVDLKVGQFYRVKITGVSDLDLEAVYEE